MKNKKFDSRDGTHLVGYLSASYSDLLEEFGEPTVGPSLDGKVQAEWEIGSSLGAITIYDYKEEKPAELVTDWYVGGHSPAVLAVLAIRLAGGPFTVSHSAPDYSVVTVSPTLRALLFICGGK